MSIEETIRGELKENEELIWFAKPKSGWAFGLYDIFLVPFTVLWFSFAILWEVMAIYGVSQASASDNGPLILFPLFGIPFILIGAFMAFGRLMVAAYVRSKTIYGISNQRLLIISTFFGKSVRTIPFQNVKEVGLYEADKHGSVYLGGDFERYLFGTLSSLTGLPMGSFHRIENARWVHDEVKKRVGLDQASTRQPHSV